MSRNGDGYDKEDIMKFSHVKDALRGKDRRIEDLTEALEHCLLAVESIDEHDARDVAALWEALEIIQEKCKQALDKH